MGGFSLSLLLTKESWELATWENFQFSKVAHWQPWAYDEVNLLRRCGICAVNGEVNTYVVFLAYIMENQNRASNVNWLQPLSLSIRSPHFTVELRKGTCTIFEDLDFFFVTGLDSSKAISFPFRIEISKRLLPPSLTLTASRIKVKRALAKVVKAREGDRKNANKLLDWLQLYIRCVINAKQEENLYKLILNC